MEVKKLQKEIENLVNKLDERRKSKHTKELAFIHLTEEVGELAREFVSKKQRPEQYDEEKLENAIGDIIIFVFYLASLYNVDVEELISKIIEEDSKRFSKE